MKIKIDGKEYSIKFGYKPTLKERIISKVSRMDNISDKNGKINMEKIEDILLFIPEFLLVGLQVCHEDFRYDYDTKEGKEEKLEKAFALVEKYLENPETNVLTLFNDLQEALTEDSFLAGMFREEQKKVNARKRTEQN